MSNMFCPIQYQSPNLRFEQPSLIEIAAKLMWANDLAKSGRVGEAMKHVETLLDDMVIDWKDVVNFKSQPMSVPSSKKDLKYTETHETTTQRDTPTR